MEVATIDWKDSKFEKDELYEGINAPQWIDLSANHPLLHHDDAWFCRPDCNHPKTADDFFIKTTPTHCKHKRSANVYEIPPLDNQNQSPFNNTEVKKRGTPKNKISRRTKHVQDSENQNPNFLTPSGHVKSITEKKKDDNIFSQNEETPRRLKSTFSARNLFAGNNILNQITEFCNELKRLATRKKERGDEHEEKETVFKKQEVCLLQEREIQNKPLLEATNVKHEPINMSSGYQKQNFPTKKRNDGFENSPIAEKVKSTRPIPSKALNSRHLEGH